MRLTLDQINGDMGRASGTLEPAKAGDLDTSRMRLTLDQINVDMGRASGTPKQQMHSAADAIKAENA